MNLSATLLLTAALLSISACATIVEGSSDNINITTSPPANATCTLTNKRGSYSTYTPSVATVKKSRTDLDVVCTDPRSGVRGESKIVSDVEPWAFGNIIIGGLLGLGIDWTSGAAYNYPDSAVVPLGAPSAAAPVAAPPPVAQTYQAPAVSAPAPAAANPPAVQYYAPAPQAQPAPTYQPVTGGGYSSGANYPYIPPSQLGARY